MNKKEILELIDKARKEAIFSKECTNAKETFLFFTDLKNLLNTMNSISDFLRFTTKPSSIYVLFYNYKYTSVRNIDDYSVFDLKYKNAFKVLNETLEDFIK